MIPLLAMAGLGAVALYVWFNGGKSNQNLGDYSQQGYDSTKGDILPSFHGFSGGEDGLGSELLYAGDAIKNSCPRCIQKGTTNAMGQTSVSINDEIASVEGYLGDDANGNEYGDTGYGFRGDTPADAAGVNYGWGAPSYDASGERQVNLGIELFPDGALEQAQAGIGNIFGTALTVPMGGVRKDDEFIRTGRLTR